MADEIKADNTSEEVEAEALSPEEAAELAQAEADFNSGFTGVETKPTEIIPPVVEETPEEIAAKAAAAAPAAVTPEMAKILASDWTSVLAKAGSIDETINSSVEKVRRDTFGKIGGLEELVRKLQSETPAGKAIEVTTKEFEELEKDYPDVAKNMALGLTRVLSQFKGTAPAAPSIDQKVIDERANEIVSVKMKELETKRAAEAIASLDDSHPGWRELTGDPKVNTPYRAWLATQTAEYQKRMFETNSDVVIGRSIDRFKSFEEGQKKAAAEAAEKAKKPTGQTKVAALRTDRLAEAVQVKGGAPAVAKGVKTPEEEFAEGFNS